MNEHTECIGYWITRRWSSRSHSSRSGFQSVLGSPFSVESGLWTRHFHDFSTILVSTLTLNGLIIGFSLFDGDEPVRGAQELRSARDQRD